MKIVCVSEKEELQQMICLIKSGDMQDFLLPGLLTIILSI
jgi:hypothetical protein